MVKFEVTEEFLEFLDEGVLSVEVWGHRRSGFSENGQTVEDKSKTFSERCTPLACEGSGGTGQGKGLGDRFVYLFLLSSWVTGGRS